MKLGLEDLRVAAGILSRQGRIVRCNKAWRNQFPTRNLLRQLATSPSRGEFRQRLAALLLGRSNECVCEVAWNEHTWLKVNAFRLLEAEDRFLITLEDLSDTAGMRARCRRFESLVDRLPEPIFFFDPESRLTPYANASLLNLFQVEFCLELQPENYGSLFDSERIENLLERLGESGSLTVETTQRTALGRRFPAELSILLINSEGNRMLACISRDLSETRRQFAALESAGSRLQAILSSVSVAIVTFTLEGLVASWNPAAEKIYGWSAQEVLLKISPLPEHYLADTIQQVVERRATRTFQASRTCRDGHKVELSLSISPLLDDAGRVVGLLEVAEDVTDRVEQELLRNNRRLVESREAERLSLARELHDGPLQEILAVRFSLAELQRQMGVAGEGLGRMQADVLRVARQLRSLTHRLRPAGLEEFGLTAALEGLVVRLSRDFAHHPDVSLDLQDIPELSPSQQLCILRVVQEAFHNCLRHARASYVMISLTRQGQQAELQISDDGDGFECPRRLSSLTASEHFGLAGMEERTLLSGGSFAIQTSRGQGTRILVTMTLAV